MERMKIAEKNPDKIKLSTAIANSRIYLMITIEYENIFQCKNQTFHLIAMYRMNDWYY